VLMLPLLSATVHQLAQPVHDAADHGDQEQPQEHRPVHAGAVFDCRDQGDVHGQPSYGGRTPSETPRRGKCFVNAALSRIPCQGDSRQRPRSYARLCSCRR
jgi:hypothetical protein